MRNYLKGRHYCKSDLNELMRHSKAKSQGQEGGMANKDQLSDCRGSDETNDLLWAPLSWTLVPAPRQARGLPAPTLTEYGHACPSAMCRRMGTMAVIYI